mmetsp:Transcript_27054/g.76250  ORF Transcript_27054/g.76250 Transcript_27054/m.76250 type:complete len:213 (+) Transcript_27054:1919-2557(+)
MSSCARGLHQHCNVTFVLICSRLGPPSTKHHSSREGVSMPDGHHESQLLGLPPRHSLLKPFHPLQHRSPGRMLRSLGQEAPLPPLFHSRAPPHLSGLQQPMHVSDVDLDPLLCHQLPPQCQPLQSLALYQVLVVCCCPCLPCGFGVCHIDNVAAPTLDGGEPRPDGEMRCCTGQRGTLRLQQQRHVLPPGSQDTAGQGCAEEPKCRPVMDLF